MGLEVKKGKPSWKPANPMDVKKIVSPDFRPRWAATDRSRISKKLAEGWVIASKENGITVDLGADNLALNTINGAMEFKELVLMVLPEELAKARDEYYDNLTNEHSLTPVQRVKSNHPETSDLVFDVNDPEFKGGN